MATDAFGSGSSSEAEVAAGARRRMGASFDNSASFVKDAAYAALNDLWTQHRRGGCDGSGAAPVELIVYHHARRFIEALPVEVPLPSASAEPDGHLSFEWYRDPRWTLSVSVSPEGNLHYSALFVDDDPRGSSPFSGEIPETILFLIRRVFQ